MTTWDTDVAVVDLYAVTLDGFFPGLRPRGHEEVLGEGLAFAAEAAGATEAEIEAEILTEVWESLGEAAEPLHEEEQPEIDVLEPPPAAPPPPSAPPVPVPVPADAAPIPRRLVRARRRIVAFRPVNVYQKQLRKLLLVITDHLRRRCGRPGEPAFERWWRVLEVYLRMLETPEMAAPKARRVLPKLLELVADDLTERRLQLVLGRRTRKRKKRKEWKR